MRLVPEFTTNDWPVSAFSGVFSAAVDMRGSRHVPVHSTGSWRSVKCVSL